MSLTLILIWQFYFVEANDLKLWIQPPATLATILFEAILKTFASIPKPLKKNDYDNYAVINVSPSVVPNPYLPSFRIFSYNVTDAGSSVTSSFSITKDRTPRHGGGRAGDKGKLCKLKEFHDTWKCRLQEPWHSDENSPSRRNRLWSPLGYAQVRGFKCTDGFIRIHFADPLITVLPSRTSPGRQASRTQI